jgi:hypothetical protein
MVLQVYGGKGDRRELNLEIQVYEIMFSDSFKFCIELHLWSLFLHKTIDIANLHNHKKSKSIRVRGHGHP